MNTACLNAGLTQPLLLFVSHLTTFTAPSKQRILSLDATISERRVRPVLLFPVKSSTDIFSAFSETYYLIFFFSSQDSTPFSAGSARRGATSSIGGASRAAGTEIIYGAYPLIFLISFMSPFLAVATKRRIKRRLTWCAERGGKSAA